MSKLTIFAASLIVALAAFSAQAQPVVDPSGYCNAIASYAESAARARDAGHPLIRVLGSLSDTPDGRAKNDMVTVLGIVFSEPHNSPASEATLAFEICWNTYGE